MGNAWSRDITIDVFLNLLPVPSSDLFVCFILSSMLCYPWSQGNAPHFLVPVNARELDVGLTPYALESGPGCIASAPEPHGARGPNRRVSKHENIKSFGGSEICGCGYWMMETKEKKNGEVR